MAIETELLVKDAHDRWFKVKKQTLEEVDKETALDAIATERNMKRDKIKTMLLNMDSMDLAILRDELWGSSRTTHPIPEEHSPPPEYPPPPPDIPGMTYWRRRWQNPYYWMRDPFWSPPEGPSVDPPPPPPDPPGMTYWRRRWQNPYYWMRDPFWSPPEGPSVDPPPPPPDPPGMTYWRRRW